jgi:hypothetical protein
MFGRNIPLDKFIGFGLLIIFILLILDLYFNPCSFYETKQSNITINGIKGPPITTTKGSKHRFSMVIIFLYSIYYIFNNDKNNYII